MSVAWAVKKTIEYASSFGSHININEIKKRLISKNRYPESALKEEILRLQWRNKKNKWRKIKVIKAKKLADKIKNNFEDVLFLGISGSVASGHPKKNDDIDILVITRSNTLWKNRFFLRWWMNINKIPHRSYNKPELNDQFCFNLWLDESCLTIPKDRQTLQNAMDLILLKPLVNKNYSYEKFLLANKWAKKFVATPYLNKISKFQVLSSKKNKKKLDKLINYIYFWPQYWYMKPKISSEIVSLHQAFFHK